MFIKLTRSGARTYAQLVESFRDEHGKPRQRTVATLGRIDEQDGQVDALLNGLLRAKGRPAASSGNPQLRFESALSLGDVWALDALWHELGFDSLGAVFRRARFTTAVEHAVRVMVFNRLCDPESKLGVLRWLQTVSMPGVEAPKLTHQHLLRSMDALMDHQQAVDDCVAQLLRPLIDEDLSVVFYALTTIRAAGLSQEDGDVRRFGMSKEGVVARQFMLGVVQTADGMPIFHEVFDGNTAEAPTLQPTLKKVLARFPHIRRLVVVWTYCDSLSCAEGYNIRWALRAIAGLGLVGGLFCAVIEVVMYLLGGLHAMLVETQAQALWSHQKPVSNAAPGPRLSMLMVAG